VNVLVKSGIEIGTSTNKASVSILLGTSDISISDGKFEGETVGVEGEQAVVISVACVAVDINTCGTVTCVMGIVICKAGVATGTNNAQAIVLHCCM